MIRRNARVRIRTIRGSPRSSGTRRLFSTRRRGGVEKQTVEQKQKQKKKTPE